MPHKDPINKGNGRKSDRKREAEKTSLGSGLAEKAKREASGARKKRDERARSILERIKKSRGN